MDVYHLNFVMFFILLFIEDVLIAKGFDM